MALDNNEEFTSIIIGVDEDLARLNLSDHPVRRNASLLRGRQLGEHFIVRRKQIRRFYVSHS
jgi:hypothetical protein